MSAPLRYRAEISCDACGQTGEHELTYAGRLLVRTRCLVCGHVVEHDSGTLASDYRSDLESRLRTKPRRMVLRLARDPIGFLVGLPVAVVRKPLRMADELRAILTRR